MPIKTSQWDSADYLHSEEDRAAYLAACLDEAPDDPALVIHALGAVARSRNMSQLARDTGLTREGLYKALSENGNPRFGTVLKVMHMLGYRLTVVRDKKPGKRTTKQAATRPVRKTPKRTRHHA